MEKTSKWKEDIIPGRSVDASPDAFATDASDQDLLHAAEVVRNLLAIVGKTKASALRMLLTPLASFCYENGIGVEPPIKLLRAAYEDYQNMRKTGEMKGVQ